MKKSTDELLQEIDRMKETASRARSIQLSDTQKKVLVHARGGDNPLSWAVLSGWWRSEFGEPKNIKTLRQKYDEMVRSGEVEKYK